MELQPLWLGTSRQIPIKEADLATASCLMAGKFGQQATQTKVSSAVMQQRQPWQLTVPAMKVQVTRETGPLTTPRLKTIESQPLPAVQQR